MILKQALSKELCYFLTHYLLRNSQENCLQLQKEDTQVIGSLAIESHSNLLDTVNEIVWPKVEERVGEKLIPTYSYSRLYQNENQLHIHRDRPSCEVSVTIQLGRSHNYSWPIFVDDTRYDLNEGDGVVYFGNKSYHWRNICEGPDGYYSGQVFLHYVRENGKFKEYGADKRWNGEIPFRRNRSKNMEEK